MVAFAASQEVHELGESGRLFNCEHHDGERGRQGVRRLRTERPPDSDQGWRQPKALKLLPRRPMEGRKSTAPEFAWSAEEVKRVGYKVVDLMADYLAQLPSRPVFQPVPAEHGEALISSPLPRAGESIDEILDRFAKTIAPYPFGNGSPKFYGWVNSPPAVVGVMAEALAAAMNPSVAGGNHAAVWVEHQVLQWFKQLVGFPSDSMGLLVSGASAAAITALNVARYRACSGRGWNVRAAGLDAVSRPKLL